MNADGAQNQTPCEGPRRKAGGEPGLAAERKFRGERSRFAAGIIRFLMSGTVIAILFATTIVLARDGRSFVIRRPAFAIDWGGIGMLVISIGMELFLMAWLFGLGACIGSFLNVVIYRTPLGLTLRGSSFCPSCRHAIRTRDNVPMFGWLALRGRCRDCRRPISPRYVRIELLLAVVFLLLAIAELGFPFFWMQRGQSPSNLGFVKLVLEPDLTRWVRCLTHLGLVATIVAAWQMSVDGHAPPPRFLVLAAVLQILPWLFFPWIGPLHWSPGHSGFLQQSLGPRVQDSWSDIIMSIRDGFWIGGIAASVCMLLVGVSWWREPLAKRRGSGVLAGLVGFALGIPWGVSVVGLALLAARVGGTVTPVIPGGMDEPRNENDTVFLKFLIPFCMMALLFASQTGSLDGQILGFLIGRRG